MSENYLMERKTPKQNSEKQEKVYNNITEIKTKKEYGFQSFYMQFVKPAFWKIRMILFYIQCKLFSTFTVYIFLLHKYKL